MATQLRLVDPPPVTPTRPSRRRAATTRATTKATSARVGRAGSGTGRRAAHWGEWKLDAHTRDVGRAGVAAARAALRQAAESESLPRAS